MTRIAVGGIWHETNAFVPGTTTLDDFSHYQFAAGRQMLERYEGTHTELGGAIEAARIADIELIPLLYAAAVPSGIVTAEANDSLAAEILNRIRRDGPFDGVLLTLHGAMTAEGEAAPEAALTRAVRSVVGQVPIAVTLDLHGNLTDELCASADVIVGYDTYPHVDMADRGKEAINLIRRMLGGPRPRTSHIKLPLLTVPQKQSTDERPMRELVAVMHRIEELSGVWTVSMLPGYPYSDTAGLGYSVYVAADHNSEDLAKELATTVWSRRNDFKPELLEPEAAIQEARRISRNRESGPVILVDVADNVGGGSPGDGTVLLQKLIRDGFDNAVSVIWDAQAVGEVYAHDAEELALSFGGHASLDLGDPIRVRGPVRRLGRVSYRRSGSYMTGQTVDMGRTAIIRTRGGDVILTELRVMPFDDDHIRVCGIEPKQRSVIIAKSAIAWKAAFGSYASQALFVRTPGFCPSDLSQLQFRHVGQSFPLREDVQWLPN